MLVQPLSSSICSFPWPGGGCAAEALPSKRLLFTLQRFVLPQSPVFICTPTPLFDKKRLQVMVRLTQGPTLFCVLRPGRPDAVPLTAHETNSLKGLNNELAHVGTQWKKAHDHNPHSLSLPDMWAPSIASMPMPPTPPLRALLTTCRHHFTGCFQIASESSLTPDLSGAHTWLFTT